LFNPSIETPALLRKTLSGFKLLRLYVQWTKRLYSLRSFGPFSFFIPFANEFATALNEKCPPQSGRHFVRVTSRVEKSNFYEDLEGVGELSLKNSIMK
jgi:hypothetical protein